MIDETIEEDKIKALREYFMNCPCLDKDGRIGVDYLGSDSVDYSIEQTPVKPLVTKYIDGSKLKQLAFVFASRQAWGADVINNLLNCKFYNDFESWIENNNENGVLPDIEGIESIECLTTGYAYQVSEMNARYQIQMRILYKC